MRKSADREHTIHALQRCFNSDTPLKRLDTKMHTADWCRVTQVSRYIRG
jgi:hypothetical protein